MLSHFRQNCQNGIIERLEDGKIERLGDFMIGKFNGEKPPEDGG
jgi:hypothetical protein